MWLTTGVCYPPPDEAALSGLRKACAGADGHKDAAPLGRIHDTSP